MDFLFKIGLEEVPARMIAGAQAELKLRVVGMLRRANLLSSEDEPLAVSFSTPRRLAVLVPKVFDKQSDSHAKVLGPAVKIAYKDGLPGPATEAFARKNGLSVTDLKVESTPKGDYLIAETKQKGRPAVEVIAEELPKELAGIYWAKNMYWLSPTGQNAAGGKGGGGWGEAAGSDSQGAGPGDTGYSLC